MNNNYLYDDPEESEDMAELEAYWKGRDDERELSGGGLSTLAGGIFIGAAIVSIAWLMTVVWSHA